MTGTALRPVAAALCLAGACLPACAGPPLGHRDFYPSDDRPIGFRGDGNGAFPGATPVSEWREGDAVEGEMDLLQWGDAGGSRHGTVKRAKVWTFTNNARVNIVWKTEMPGFSNSSPIVVGDRVFCMADPYTLVCVDVPTGKILWQRDVNPFRAMGLGDEKVRKLTQLMEICQAVHSVGGSLVANYTRLPKEFREEYRASWLQRFELVAKLSRQAVALDPDNAFGSADLRAQNEQVMRTIRALKPGDSCKDLAGKVGSRYGGLYMCIEKPMRKAFGFYLADHWAGMVNHDFPTPVSDGRRVYVSLGQGQVAGIDLNGHLVWARHVKVDKWRDFTRCTHCPSPLLAGGVLVAQQVNKLVGFDKRTGAVLWENPEIHLNYGWGLMGTYKHLRLRNGERAMDVIVPSHGKVLDAATGRIVCTLPGEASAKVGGTTPPVMGTPDGYVCLWYGGRYVTCRLTLGEGGCVSAKQVVVHDAKWRSGTGLILDGKRIIATSGRQTGVYDMLTGRRLSQFASVPGKGFHGLGPILAGKYVVGTRGLNDDDNLRPRADETIVEDCMAIDLTDPARPRTICNRNLLGGFNKPHVRHIEKWLPELNNRGWVTMSIRPAKALWAMMGVPPNWGYASPAAQGSRLFFRSHSHLYCIGDPRVPYDWNPASRPLEVTRCLSP